MRRIAVLGTDTAVGKTHVTLLITAGLRRLGWKVWLHKPVACGGWEGGAWPHGTAEDARRLAAALGDGQPLATLCPRQFPGDMSPHLAAAQVGERVLLAELLTAVPASAEALVIIETAGGLLSPMTSERATNADVIAALDCPCVLVARAHLGTLNHTSLTVAEARRRGIRLLGLIVNYHGADLGSPAIATAAAELGALTGLPVLGQVGSDDGADALSARLAAMLPAVQLL